MRAGYVVLVVEDEALVRMVAVDALLEAGYLTLEAANADQAICLLEAHPEIRLVFTDVQMPGSMDGVNLAAAVRKLKSDGDDDAPGRAYLLPASLNITVPRRMFSATEKLIVPAVRRILQGVDARHCDVARRTWNLSMLGVFSPVEVP